METNKYLHLMRDPNLILLLGKIKICICEGFYFDSNLLLGILLDFAYLVHVQCA